MTPQRQAAKRQKILTESLGRKAKDSEVPPALDREKKEVANEEEGRDREETKARADTIMGFPSHLTSANREIMLEHLDFFRWAKEQQNPVGGQQAFLERCQLEEGKALKMEGMGNDIFGFGQHRGESFQEIAENEPTYHERFMKILSRRNEEPNAGLARYIHWYKKYKQQKHTCRNSKKVAPVRNRILSNKSRKRFPFGQHKGKTF